MPKSQYLFDLVSSLEKQENRYVQLFIRKNAIGGSSNYLDLYKAVAAQEQYDEKALKKKFKGHPVGKTFAVTKYYLYELVLKALASYHAEGSPAAQLSQLIQRARLLAEKKLYEQCGELARKAMKLAQKYEEHGAMIELLDLELYSYHALTDIKKVRKLSGDYYEKKKDLLDKQGQISYLQKLSYENFIWLKTKWVKEGKGRPEVYYKLTDVKEDSLGSFRARMQYYQSKCAYQFSVGDYDGAYEALTKALALFDAQPVMIGTQLAQYVATLNNMNVLHFRRNDYKKVLEVIGKMRAIKPTSVEGALRLKERIVNVELNVYRNTGEVEKARPVLAEAKKLLEGKKLSKVYRLLTLMDLFFFHFASGEYRLALRWLNAFFSEPAEGVREDVQRTARILNMLVHYELGHFDYFDSLIRSSRRFFRRQEEPDAFEELFISFFGKVILCNSKNETSAAFGELVKALKAAPDKGFTEETYLQNFPFLSWAEAKFTGRPLAEVLRERSGLLK